MIKRNYNSNLSFNDLLFNALLGFVVLFVIAFLMMNPVAKTQDIPAHAEFMITISWPSGYSSDVDVWILGPIGGSVGFKNKDNGYLHLERDDLGILHDEVEIQGVRIVSNTNQEIVSVRGIVPGDYFLNIHLYSKKDSVESIPVTITVADVNPYTEAYTLTMPLVTEGDIYSAPGFTVDKNGHIENVFTHDKIIINKK